MKTLLLFVVAFFAYLLVRFIMKRVNEIRQDALSGNEQEQNTTSEKAERMATCVECGLRLPESEAIPLNPAEKIGDTYNIAFCSQEHKQLYLKKHS
ncbi:hypothetical protein [Hydrogenovibrio marinus]|uniref:Uncharacterized protein n=1 Tax=Hydrogenovibrio marinus TaxID=28885 RepID=A0A066ZYC3_HYDMR|nr:hypothetical protein [Hydrogenovibrio marinus]KDN95351.1 hypothetical protein EI16_03360 [Hydrogenovibrio marinus]BBN59838.1 hypothetical protein HVMH_1432 [Hydrogenovibrio marinus]